MPALRQGHGVFGKGGGDWMSHQTGVPFLGAIPLEADIVVGGDEGRPLFLTSRFSWRPRLLDSRRRGSFRAARRSPGQHDQTVRVDLGHRRRGTGVGRKCRPGVGFSDHADRFPP